jgi:predicted nuclease of predicted toxin-antitoxin system
VRFLVDNNLSPVVARLLEQAGHVGRRAPERAAVILANLDDVTEDLSIGAVVVLSDEWVRIRRLPLLP